MGKEIKFQEMQRRTSSLKDSGDVSIRGLGRDGVEFAALVEEAAFAIMKEGARNGSRILAPELSIG